MFEEAQQEDSAQMDMPGAVDINSHQDMFHSVFEKVGQREEGRERKGGREGGRKEGKGGRKGVGFDCQSQNQPAVEGLSRNWSS